MLCLLCISTVLIGDRHVFSELVCVDMAEIQLLMGLNGLMGRPWAFQQQGFASVYLHRVLWERVKTLTGSGKHHHAVKRK